MFSALAIWAVTPTCLLQTHNSFNKLKYLTKVSLSAWFYNEYLEDQPHEKILIEVSGFVDFEVTELRIVVQNQLIETKGSHDLIIYCNI